MSYIRNVELSDAEVLVEIYRPYVENTAISFECETPSVDEFRSRIENISKSILTLLWWKTMKLSVMHMREDLKDVKRMIGALKRLYM